MRITDRKVTTSVTLPLGVLQELDEVVIRLRRSRSELVAIAVKRMLENLARQPQASEGGRNVETEVI